MLEIPHKCVSASSRVCSSNATETGNYLIFDKSLGVVGGGSIGPGGSPESDSELPLESSPPEARAKDGLDARA